MGIESCGMLLSAIHEEEGEEKLHLLMVDNHIPACLLYTSFLKKAVKQSTAGESAGEEARKEDFSSEKIG